MNINSDFDLKKAKNFLLTENFDASYLQEDDLDENEEVSLEEMAKLTGKEGALTPLGQKVAAIVKAQPELEKSALLKALNADPEIAKMLDDSEEELHQNQTNKFAALVRGSREVGQRGRKADPNKPAAEPKAPKAPGEKKIKITTSKSEPSADDKIDVKVEKDARSRDEMIKEKRKLEAERAELLKAFKAGDTSATAKLKAIMAPINALNKKLGV
jgi:hypothetical protein